MADEQVFIIAYDMRPGTILDFLIRIVSGLALTTPYRSDHARDV